MKLLEILAGQELAVRSKVWLELNGRPFLGEGRYTILKAIDLYGSLARVSEETGVSYRKIRGTIYLMEKTVGMQLVIRSRGGKEGGGAMITDTARELISLFEKQEKGIREAVDDLHRSTFGQWQEKSDNQVSGG